MESSGFNVVSWNVNGLRTINIKDTLAQLNCFILGIQETKLTRDVLSQQDAIIDNYTSCFSFCRNRTGYSGVALYCRDDIMPNKSEDGLSGLLNKKYSKSTDSLIASYGNVEENEKVNAAIADDDGRSILTQHIVKMPDGGNKLLTVINVYCPRLRNDPDDPVDNTEFKYTFHNTLGKRAQSLVAAGSFVVIMGDFNIAHRPIDRVETDDTEEFAGDTFRQWIDELLSNGFVDTFRMLHPDAGDAFTCWCSRTNARQNNYGSRIDYIMVDAELSTYLERAEVHSDIFGSDHCPISATFHTLIPVPAERPPVDAAKYYREFYGKQTNLKDFLNRNNGCSVSQNAFEIFSRTKSKRNGAGDGRQADITKFFVKKPKLTTETSSTQGDTNGEKTITKNAFECFAFEQSKEKSLSEINQDASKKWKDLLTTPNTPSCAGHHELCVLRTVRKKGLNQGRKFWACPRGVGQSNDPNANCNHFAWVVNTKT